MNFSQNPILKILYRTAQVLYFPLLLLLIGWQKILSIFGFSESSAMDDFVKPLIFIILCIGIPLSIGIPLWIYVKVIIAQGKKSVDTKKRMLVQAPTKWIIPGFVGWIYVNEGKQVGIIGDKVYVKSDFFVESSGTQKDKFILSCQEYRTDLSIKTMTSENTQSKVDTTVKYSARPNFVLEIMKEADPEVALNKDLQTTLIGFIRTYQFTSLVNNHVQARRDFEVEISNALPQYNFSVSVLNVDGGRAEDLDALSRKEEAISKAKIKAEETLIQGVIDLQIKGAELTQELQIKQNALKNFDDLLSGKNTNQQIGSTTSNKLFSGYDDAVFFTELKKCAKDLSINLTNESPPYLMQYKSYGIQLQIDAVRNSFVLEIQDYRNVRIASGAKPLNLPLLTILLDATKYIDSAISKNNYD